uniref:Uncharacterized protein n=1 Tax=Branchiostoma floridae TaxID=7739 RepID=C3YKT1_BRAFL|eukprot:XP_002603138.1 hypothetical protein BRAFLDRAFT_63229 [Branchiostoma floridae]
MWRRWRHLLMFLLIILKEPNTPEADCSCRPFSRCSCLNRALSSIPQNLPTSIITLDFRVFGFVLIGSIILTIYYKRRSSQPPLGPNPNVIGNNTNATASVLSSDYDNHYENIDNHHDQTGQGQSQANAQSQKVGKLSHDEVLAALKPNVMYAGVGSPPNVPASTNNHDQTGQGQSQANTQSLKVGSRSHNKVLAALKPNAMYAGVETPPKVLASTNNHDQTGQGQSHGVKVGNLSHDEVLAALQPNVMYAGVVTPPKDQKSTIDHNQYEHIDNHHDQTGQGQSQAITESNTNTTADVNVSGHSQTGDQLITESLDTKSPQHGIRAPASIPKLNSLYKNVGQYQAIVKSNTNTTDAVVTSGHDHQYEDMNQHNKVEQGPSKLSTKSNANTTATAVTSDLDHQYEDINQHYKTGQGQSQKITEPLDARNFSYGSGPTASQLNSLYAN